MGEAGEKREKTRAELVAEHLNELVERGKGRGLKTEAATAQAIQQLREEYWKEGKWGGPPPEPPEPEPPLETTGPEPAPELEPVEIEPAPLEAQPTETPALDSEPTEPGELSPEPVESAALEPEAVEPAELQAPPVEPEVLEAEPVEPGPLAPEPVPAEPMAAPPVEPVELGAPQLPAPDMEAEPVEPAELPPIELPTPALEPAEVEAPVLEPLPQPVDPMELPELPTAPLEPAVVSDSESTPLEMPDPDAIMDKLAAEGDMEPMAMSPGDDWREDVSERLQTIEDETPPTGYETDGEPNTGYRPQPSDSGAAGGHWLWFNAYVSWPDQTKQMYIGEIDYYQNYYPVKKGKATEIIALYDGTLTAGTIDVNVTRKYRSGDVPCPDAVEQLDEPAAQLTAARNTALEAVLAVFPNDEELLGVREVSSAGLTPIGYHLIVGVKYVED